jgi:hypothetical protein
MSRSRLGLGAQRLGLGLEGLVHIPGTDKTNQGRLQRGQSGRSLRPIWLRGGKNSAVKGGVECPERLRYMITCYLWYPPTCPRVQLSANM